MITQRALSAWCVAAAVSLAPVAAQAPSNDACSFKPIFQPGQRFAYEYENVSEHLPPKAMPEPGKEPDPPEPISGYTTIATLIFEVVSVEPDGTATLSMKPEDIQIAVLDDFARTSAGFTRKLAAYPSPLPKGAGYLPRIALALARSEATIKIGPDGVVTEAAGLEDVYKLVEQEPPETRGDAARVIAPLGPAAIKRTLTTFFRIDVRGDDGDFPARRPGDSWTMVDRVPSRGGMDLVATATLTLDSCTPGLASISGSAAMTVEPGKPVPGAEPNPLPGTPTINEFVDRITITWNAKRGLVQWRERDSILDIYAKVGDEKQNEARVHTNSTLKLVEAPK